MVDHTSQIWSISTQCILSLHYKVCTCMDASLTCLFVHEPLLRTKNTVLCCNPIFCHGSTVDLKKLTFCLRSTIVYGKKVRIPMCNSTKLCLVVRSYYGTKVCIPVAMQFYETMFNIVIVKLVRIPNH